MKMKNYTQSNLRSTRVDLTMWKRLLSAENLTTMNVVVLYIKSHSFAIALILFKSKLHVYFDTEKEKP